MYKIMIHIDTHTNDTWFYYQEEGKDYVANSLEEIRETVLTLIDVYGEDYIKIVKQETGDDMNGSVETFLYDSTDNYEELVNRPFINGVEIVGALSLAELGIQPVGNYATNERVDALEETVNNIDFSPYATNARVDQVEYKVDNIDLTPYATNERVDQVEAKVDAIDLEPYATIDYLDEVVAGIDFSASNENITGVKTFSVLPRSTVVPVTEDELTNKAYVDHEVFGCATEEYVDEAIANIQIPVFEVAALGAVQYDAYMTEEEGKRFLEYCNEHYNEFIQVYLYCPTSSLSGIYSGTPVANDWGNGIFKLYSNATGYKSGIIYGTHLYVHVDMTEDGKFDTTQSCRPYIHCETMLNVSANYLSRTNTREYTPTTAYHPATKKYVDDTITSGIAGIPEPDMSNYPTLDQILVKGNTEEYTPELDYEPSTKKYVDDVVAAIDVSGGEYTIDDGAFYSSSGNFRPNDLDNKTYTLGTISKNNLSTAITNIINSNKPKKIKLEFFGFGSKDFKSECYLDLISDKQQQSQYFFQGIWSFAERETGYDSYLYNLAVYGSFVNNSFTCSSATLKVQRIYLSYLNSTNDFVSSSQVLIKNNATEYTPTSDYHPATKKYIDDAIAEIPTGPNNIIRLTGAYDFFKNYDTGYLRFNDIDLLSLQNYINDNYDGVTPESLLPLNIINNSTKPDYSNAQNIIITDVRILGSYITFTGHIYFTDAVIGTNNSPYTKIYDISLFAEYAETDGVYTISVVGFRTRPRAVDCLTRGNTIEYTPIGDYNPATKKYVDDAVANIDVSDVDLTNYYNKTEVDNKINEMLSSAITNTLEGGY